MRGVNKEVHSDTVYNLIYTAAISILGYDV